MEWLEASEIVSGLVMVGKIPPNAVDPNLLISPYDNIVRLSKLDVDKAGIMDAVGFNAVNTSMQAGESVESKLDFSNYLAILEKSCVRHEVGVQLERYAKKLRMGEDVDVAKISAVLQKIDDGLREFTTLDKVEADTDVWRPCYYRAIDEYIGGFHKFGLHLAGAPPGTGKTTLAGKILCGYVRAGVPVAMFSLEMTLGLVKARIQQIDPKLKPKDFALIHASDAIGTYEETCASMGEIVAKYPDIQMIAVDYADLMIPEHKMIDAAMAGQLYVMIANTAKRIKRPILLLSQLNDNYIGGLPRINHVRWSRLAEATASMIILPYNPGTVYVDMGENMKKNPLPFVEGRAYLICGKSRFGTKSGGIGAVQVGWDGVTGWGEPFGWFSL